jgi:hypothetical protein
MSQLRWLLLFACLAAACPAAGRSAAEERVVEPLVVAEHGAIFPASRSAREALVPGLGEKEIDSYWTPNVAQIADLESRLQPFLERRVASDKAEVAKLPWIRRSQSTAALDQGHVANILARLPTTRRQYLGIVVDGVQRIVVNCFPVEGFPDWDRQFIFVLDGGDWFWEVQYDVPSRTFLRFQFNGEA